MVRVGGGVRLLAPSLSFSACLFVLSSFQQAYGRSMCSILDQRTAIVDDRLFFCSGNYTFDDDGLPRHTTSSIYWIYLNDTLDVTGPLDLELLGSTGLSSESLNGGKNPDPGGSAGTFFYDHTTLYPYAGLVGPEADGINNALWAFNTSDNTWKLEQVMGGKISFGNNSEGVHASDPRTGTSFYTGGWTTAYNGTYNGTVKFQSSMSGNPRWDFVTAVVGMPGPNILKGSMVYVRKGRAGILVAFGGYQTAYPGTTVPDWPWDQRPLDEIFIYDIYSNTWYQQTATGDVPELRAEFCAVVSSAPDDSSFQITIHGGWDQLKRRAFNDVYVLSVPSFRWIKVEDSDNPDLEGLDKPGRNRHKCNMWNETSMLVTGGQITLGEWDTVLLTDMCNPEYPPVKVLDTSTYKWQTEFNPRLTYSVPEVVTNVIGGDSSGGARLIEPEMGWASEELADIFNETVERDTYIPPSRPEIEGPPNTEDDPKSSERTSGSLSAGAIAGIVIGAVAAVAGILWGFLSRRSSRRKKQARGEDVPSVTNAPLIRGVSKRELDATPRQRYELGAENNVYEMQGEGIGNGNIGELPAYSPSHREV